MRLNKIMIAFSLQQQSTEEETHMEHSSRAMMRLYVYRIEKQA